MADADLKIIRDIEDKSKPDRECHAFFCPACHCGHWFSIPPWTWNKDRVKPTIRASILVRGTIPITDDEAARIMKGEKLEPKPFRCHSFITDGKIKFLADCTHALAGKIVDLEAF